MVSMAIQVGHSSLMAPFFPQGARIQAARFGSFLPLGASRSGHRMASLYFGGQAQEHSPCPQVQEQNAALHRQVARLEGRVQRKKIQIQGIRQALYSDPLTQIPNRAFFNKVAAPIYCRAVKQRQPLTLILTDLDRFKGINDTYGHDAGDEALRRFARALERAVGDEGTVFRLGGDEFVVLLPETSNRRAHKFTARIKAEVKRERFNWPGADHPIQLGVSQGVVTMIRGRGENPQRVNSAEDMKTLADSLMYQAKQSARQANTRNPISYGVVEHEQR